jgi:hypothetical protein
VDEFSSASVNFSGRPAAEMPTTATIQTKKTIHLPRGRAGKLSMRDIRRKSYLSSLDCQEVHMSKY